jgi:hypothetical protein
MSLFKKITLPCPACEKSVDFDAVHSVNADRRADLRKAILDGSFQRQACTACGKAFRLDPEFNYIDLGRNEWYAVHPRADVDRWRELEGESRGLWDRAYGAKAPALAKEMGQSVKPRLVFGWPALNEKLSANQHGLDDVQLELLKVGLMKSLPESPYDLDTELRLLEVRAGTPDQLVLGWIESDTANLIQALGVPREVYDDVAADPDAWKALRAEFDGALFIDTARLLTVGA